MSKEIESELLSHVEVIMWFSTMCGSLSLTYSSDKGPRICVSSINKKWIVVETHSSS
jgi:hypothetical protein